MTTFRTKQKIVLIGREHFCEVRGTSLMLSRHHVTIAVNANTATIRAMRTSNGTFVNGARLEQNTEIEGKPGDIITAGPYSFVFSFEQCADGTTDFVVTDAHSHLNAVPEPNNNAAAAPDDGNKEN